MTSANVLLFVYGTLRSDADNSKAHLLGGRLLATGATISGTLHDYTHYPAVVLGGTSTVIGEVWSVPKDNLARLDRYEGCEYVRVATDATYTDYNDRPHVLHNVMVYEAVDPTGFPVIPCGDWVERHASA